MTRATLPLFLAVVASLLLVGCNERASHMAPPPGDKAPNEKAGDSKSGDKASTERAAIDKSSVENKPAEKTAPDKTTSPDKTPADKTSADSEAPNKAASTEKPAVISDAKPDSGANAEKPKPEGAKPEAAKPETTTTPAPEEKTPAPTPDTSKPEKPTAPGANDSSSDWPNWRGPNQDRVAHETGLIDHWNFETKENVLWDREDCASRCTPIVMRGKLYTIARYKPGTRQEQEQTVCLDAATGEVIWRNLHNMFLSDVPAERIGWASPVGDPETGRVYAFGSNCYLQCFEGDTGKVVWSRSLAEQFGFLSVFGGRTNFPIIIGNILLVSAVDTGWGDRSTPAHRFLALDKNTGEVLWFNKGTTERPEDTTFSTPYVGTVDGVLQFIEGSSDGAVWGFEPNTGRPLWKYQMSRRGLSCSPALSGDTAYMAQNEENLDNFTTGMVAAFKVKCDATKPDVAALGKEATLWKLPGKMINKSTQCSPVLYEGRLYAADNASNLYVIDAAKGKILQKVKLTGDETVGSPLVADGKIYLCTTTGWHVFKPTQRGVEVVDQSRMPEENGRVMEVLGSVIASGGRVYLPTTERLFCLGKKVAAGDKSKGTDEAKSGDAVKAAEALTAAVSAKSDKNPAQLVVIPGEVLLKPGEKQQFRVELFDDAGQPVKKSDEQITFELKGPGKIDKSGQYQAADGDAHTATIVTAKLGDIAGQARIRVVPPLPWKFDFQKIPLVENPKTKIPEGVPSQTWIGLNYRHVIREIDGRKVMVKVNNIPKGTRSQGWMGPDDLHDYTIQADIQAKTTYPDDPARGMPDVGLIAQRYTLMLMGADQQLQIRYWPPQVHTQFSKTLPFEWKDKVWYTIKFQASTADGKATLKGKVWSREEKEPEAWTIEVTDEMPNLQGSPGLAGDTSNRGEFYYDNIQVYANDSK